MKDKDTINSASILQNKKTGAIRQALEVMYVI
jgi:hypothetical protein